MKIKLWGVRGSIPTPITGDLIEKKIRRALTLAKPGDITSHEAIDEFITSLPFSIKSTFGGNTTSMEVISESGEIVIIDLGSGAKNLGKDLMGRGFGEGKGVGTVLFTHTHWDHVQGIPFFLPFYIEGNRFNIYSPYDDLKERLDHQHSYAHFPISLDYMKAEKEFFLIPKEDELFLNDLRVLNKMMPHPGMAYGYRIEENGKSFVYTSDCEFNVHQIDNIQKYRDFFLDADVVVFDTMYTFEESIHKMEFGHSSASIAIDIAGMFNVKRLILFHHEPDYNDEKLENVLANAKTYLTMNPNRPKDLIIDIAYEGMEINL